MQEEQEQVMQMQQQQHNNNNNNYNNNNNMNMNNMMSSSSSSATSNYYANNNNNLTTHHIQQYLDENKSLILKIVESQNSGKLSECAENQVRLQRNLMYLAAIADSQPQPAMHSQYGQSGMMQSGAHYLQAQQQAAARSSPSILYTQQQYSALQQQQAMNSHLGTHFLHSEANSNQQLCPDLMTPGKQDMDARLGRTSSADDN